VVSKRRNWNAFAGFLLGVAGIVVYFALVLTQDPALHRFLQTPLPNLAMIVLGLSLSIAGVRQALRGTHRGRVVAPVLALLNVGFAGLFGWYLFSYSYRMPAAARAPVVGSVAPDFALRDQRGNEVRLSSLRGRPVVLVFYRGHW
jgi:hypothetical protein